MADDPQIETPEPDPAPAPESDLSFIPESFRTEDGKPDPGAFVQRFEELTAEEARRAEALESLPKDPKDYALDIPEDVIPEELRDLKDEQGNPLIPRSVSGEDADAFRALAHELKLPQEAVSKLIALDAQRGFRQIIAANEAKAEQLKSLGDYQARHADVARKLAAIMPEKSSKALLEDLTTADAFKAVERLISRSPQPKNVPGTAGVDIESLSPFEKLEFANRRAEAGGRK